MKQFRTEAPVAQEAAQKPAQGVGVACGECDGRGWLGAATGGQFAALGRLAAAGALPTRTCPVCQGAKRPLRHG